MRAGTLGWLVALVLTLASWPAIASAEDTRPVVLVECDRLRLEDLSRSELPHLVDLARHGAVGLMNCAVPAPRTDAARQLALALGEQQPAETTDRDVCAEDQRVIGEPGLCIDVYCRRTGMPRPPTGPSASTLRHLGIAPLVRREIAARTLGATLSAPAGIEAAIASMQGTDPDEGAAALLVMDASGTAHGSLRAILRPETVPGVLPRGGFLVIRAAGMPVPTSRARGTAIHSAAARSLALRDLDRLLGVLSGRCRDLLLISPQPPVSAHPGSWELLAPALFSGADFPPGLLSSPSTRTGGLIANIDVAPTILGLFHRVAPATFTGRPVHSVAALGNGDTLSFLGDLNEISTLNGRAAILVTVPFAAIGLPAICLALLQRRARGKCWAPLRYIPLFGQNLAAGMLFAPLLKPQSLPAYGGTLVPCMAVLTLISLVVGRRTRLSPPVISAAILFASLTIALVADQNLLKYSILSGYALSGIRYYGIGNEYLGVVLGFAITGGMVLLDDLKPLHERSARALPWLLPLGLALFTLLMGWPALGANAGSLPAGGAAVAALAVVLHRGRRVYLWAAGGAVAGILLAVAFSALEARSPGASHMGAAVASASRGRGAGYLVAIASRKIAMNLRLLGSFWLLVAAGAVLAAAAATAWIAGPDLRALGTTRPSLRLAIPPWLSTCAVALLFKDSGVVTAVYLAGSSAVIILHALLNAGPAGQPGKFVRPAAGKLAEIAEVDAQ